MANVHCTFCGTIGWAKRARWKNGLCYCRSCWTEKNDSDKSRKAVGVIHSAPRDPSIFGRVVVVPPSSPILD